MQALPPIQLPSAARYLSIDTIHQIGQEYLLQYGDPSLPTPPPKSKWQRFFQKCCHRENPNLSPMQKRWALWALKYDKNTFNQEQAWYELANMWRAGTYDVMSNVHGATLVSRVTLFLAKYAQACFETAFGMVFDQTRPIEQIYNSLNANIGRVYQNHPLSFKAS